MWKYEISPILNQWLVKYELLKNGLPNVNEKSQFLRHKSQNNLCISILFVANDSL